MILIHINEHLVVRFDGRGARVGIHRHFGIFKRDPEMGERIPIHSRDDDFSVIYLGIGNIVLS